MMLRNILVAAAVPTSRETISAEIPKGRELFDEFRRTGAAGEHRHFVAIGWNRRHHRDFGEAGARAFDNARDGLLDARRNGIEVGVNDDRRQIRGVLLGGVKAWSAVTADIMMSHDSASSRFDSTRRVPVSRARCRTLIGNVDIESRSNRFPVAQALGDVIRSFAETNKSDPH